jgi:SAM-dependent methyltransferase
MAMTVTTTDGAQRLLRLGSAFCEAQALLAAVECGVFTALDATPATVDQLRQRLGLHGRGLPELLRLLVRSGVLEESAGVFTNTDDAAAHLVADRPGYVGGALLGAKNNLYPVWSGLSDALRTGRPVSAGQDFRRMVANPAEVRRYAAMMAGALRPLLPGLLASLPWARYRDVVDVGGCRGELVGELVRAHAGLTGRVFDLPELAPAFTEHMSDLGVTGRTAFVPGDFFTDPLPTTDVIVLGHVLHNWDATRRESLLRAAYRALRPGGVLLVYDRMLDGADSTVDNLVASLTMLLVTDGGGEYPVAELTGAAGAAGFTSTHTRRLDANETLVICRR